MEKATKYIDLDTIVSGQLPVNRRVEGEVQTDTHEQRRSP